VVEIVNKRLNNPNDVFSGITRRNWWSEVVEYAQHCTVLFSGAEETALDVYAVIYLSQYFFVLLTGTWCGCRRNLVLI
jgi:hypothetical protein